MTQAKGPTIATVLDVIAEESVTGLGVWQHELAVIRSGASRMPQRDALRRISYYDGRLSAIKDMAASLSVAVPALDRLAGPDT
jgi:hypothetical protein